MIKYRFRIQVSPKTSYYHLNFEDILAGRRLWPLFDALISSDFSTDDIWYEHGGGMNPSIAMTEDGVSIFNDMLAPYVWLPDDEEGRCYFVLDDVGQLVRPENCSVCGHKNPSITETLVENGRAVAVNKYCDSHGEYTQQMLIEAGLNG